MIQNTLTLTLAIKAKKYLLEKEDYKVIKCAEAMLMGEDMPYDTGELIAKRNEIRAEINALEEEIKLKHNETIL